MRASLSWWEKSWSNGIDGDGESGVRIDGTVSVKETINACCMVYTSQSTSYLRGFIWFENLGFIIDFSSSLCRVLIPYRCSGGKVGLGGCAKTKS